MKTLVMLAIVGLSCLSTLAQEESAEYKACAAIADTQDVMTRCANEEVKRVNIEHDGVYKRLLTALSNNKRATAKTIAAQQAWIVYRRAYLDAMYPDTDKSSYGSIFPMEFDLLHARLTRQHIKELLDLLHNVPTNW